MASGKMNETKLNRETKKGGQCMEKKQLDITNMNGVTEDEDTTCGLNDMNCVGEDEVNTCGLNDMNCLGEDDDTTCGLNDMNCLDEEEEEKEEKK